MWCTWDLQIFLGWLQVGVLQVGVFRRAKGSSSPNRLAVGISLLKKRIFQNGRFKVSRTQGSQRAVRVGTGRISMKLPLSERCHDQRFVGTCLGIFHNLARLNPSITECNNVAYPHLATQPPHPAHTHRRLAFNGFS